MNYAQINQRYVCGVDLHSMSLYLKILDRKGPVLYKRNMPNNLVLFKEILTPYFPDIAVGAESTFNYYWLYNGCADAGIPFYSGHAVYIKNHFWSVTHRLKMVKRKPNRRLVSALKRLI